MAESFCEYSLECFSAFGVREHPNSKSMLFLLVRVITRAHLCLLGEGAPELKRVLPMGVRIFRVRKFGHIAGSWNRLVFSNCFYFDPFPLGCRADMHYHVVLMTYDDA